MHAALEEVLQTARPSVQRGLKPGPEAGWTVQQYAETVRAITAGASYAVLASVLEAQFGGGSAGRQVLQAMVRNDLVAYRPYSSWARDLPVGAFRASDRPNPELEEVVTAPSPAHLHCMQKLMLPDPAPPADPVGRRPGGICRVSFCHTAAHTSLQV